MDGMQENIKLFVSSPCKVLDVGSRKVYRKHGIYKTLFTDADEYVGLDLVAGDNVDVVIEDPYVYPFEDGTFDAILCGQVVEHCKNPFKLMAECSRVLKPGGVFIGSAPFIWKEHKHPRDCWRILPDGWKVLFEESGLDHLRSYYDPDAPRNVLITFTQVTCFGIARKPGGSNGA